MTALTCPDFLPFVRRVRAARVRLGQPASRVEADAFAALLAPHSALVQGLALKLTRSRPDADDVVQESLYRALRGFDGFERGTSFRAWILRIVTNTFLEQRRRDIRRACVLVDVDVADHGSAQPAEALLAVDWSRIADRLDDGLKDALEALPDQFRLPLLMSGFVGLSHREIGAALGIPVGTVMSRLFRARQRVRKALESAGGVS